MGKIKRATILMVISILLSSTLLIACGNSKPKDLSDDDYRRAKEIVEIVDDVLDGKMDADKLGVGFEIKYKSIDDVIVSSKALMLTYEVLDYADGKASSNGVLEQRNELAEYIGIKKKK